MHIQKYIPCDSTMLALLLTDGGERTQVNIILPGI